MEVLAPRAHAEFISSSVPGKNEFLGFASNITKLHSNGSEQDAGYFHKTFENAEINAVNSWVDPNPSQQPPCNNSISISQGEPSEKKASDERDQNQIKYLLSKLPILAEQFNIHRKVGEGTFSSVFLGTLKNSISAVQPVRQFAIKHLVPTTLPARTEKELQCLQDIGGSDNVIGIDLCLRQGDCIVFIMPYLQHKRFSDYVQDMTVAETREYMGNLFIALRKVHSFNIIHRDIKPSNFLYDRENKKFLLVDFGLAQNVTSTDMLSPEATASHSKKRKREEDDKYNSTQGTPEMPKLKRMALQPRVNESNKVSISRRETPHAYKPSLLNHKPSEVKKGPAENDIRQLLSPTRNKYLGKKNENTPPNGKKTPRRKLMQNDEIRSPLKDSRNNMKHSSIKKKLFPTGSPRVSNGIHTGGLKFQTLAPETANGPSFVRVQNSQVKSHLLSPPISTQQQKKLVFSKPSPVTQSHSKTLSSQNCHCYGKPKICSVCMVRKVQAAPRAGTPGFRPPEVLLKYPLQTTAVDMWAAGIILLCILSGCYPFFPLT